MSTNARAKSAKVRQGNKNDCRVEQEVGKIESGFIPTATAAMSAKDSIRTNEPTHLYANVKERRDSE